MISRPQCGAELVLLEGELTLLGQEPPVADRLGAVELGRKAPVTDWLGAVDWGLRIMGIEV